MLIELNKKFLLKSEFGRGLDRTVRDWDEALGQNREDGQVMRKLSWCQAQWEVYRKAIKFIYGTEYHFTRTDEYFGLCTEDEKDWLLSVEREPVKCWCIQKVKEHGIKCNEVEYYNEDFVKLYLGQDVRVIETEKTVKVRDLQGDKIIHFPKLPVEKVKEMFKGFTPESIRVATEATQSLVEFGAEKEQPVPAEEITPTPSMRKAMQELESAQESVWNPQNCAALRKALWETLEIMLESELFTRAAQRGLEDYEFVVSSNISTMVDSVLGRYERLMHYGEADIDKLAEQVSRRTQEQLME